MSSVSADQFYQLLPAIYRLRDAEQGYPLQALIQVLASQAQVVEGDIAHLYENWFIETCEEWVVPYLGDLLGVRGLLPPERAGWSQRALVANTLGYRQRKGTVPLLEQLAHDVAGWAARAVELYNRVSVTQYLDHQRPGLGGTADLRQSHDMALVGSAFDPLAYTPDVRLMSGTLQAPQLEAERPVSWPGARLVGVGQGRPNLPNIGLFIWRLKPYPLERATASPYGGGQHFSFSPLGNDLQLFNNPAERRDFAHVAEEHELPVALRIEPLAEELAARRRALHNSLDPVKHFFGDQPPFEIYLPGSATPLLPEQLVICDLSNWSCDRNLPEDQQGNWGAVQAAVDPVLGRILLANGITNEATLQVSYSYAFGDDIGGGPYDRRHPESGVTDTVSDPCVLKTLIVIGAKEKDNNYSCTPQYIAPDSPQPLSDALQAWTTQAPAVIQIQGNATFPMPIVRSPQARITRLLNIVLQGAQLVVQAANRCRPVLVGDLMITGNAPTAELTLSGLLIQGQICISGKLGQLTIVDCTIVPGIERAVGLIGPFTSQQIPSICASTDFGNALQVKIERSIVGPICLPDTIDSLTISDSIIDAPAPDTGGAGRMNLLTTPGVAGPLGPQHLVGPGGGIVIRPIIEKSQLPAIAGNAQGGPGPKTCLERVTVFGQVHVSEMPLAEDVLFTAPVTVGNASSSLARHCYIPAEPTLPKEECLDGSEVLLPAFTARRYGEPGYAQLSLACPAEIRAGGTNGAEIGVFHNLCQPQREGALLAQLEEYLRFGLEAGLIYVD